MAFICYSSLFLLLWIYDRSPFFFMAHWIDFNRSRIHRIFFISRSNKTFSRIIRKFIYIFFLFAEKENHFASLPREIQYHVACTFIFPFAQRLYQIVPRLSQALGGKRDEREKERGRETREATQSDK